MANMITSQKVARAAAFDLFMVLLLQFNVANRAGSEETDRCDAAFVAMLFSLGAQCQSLFSSFQRAAPSPGLRRAKEDRSQPAKA
jgi:hypothetical protein